MRCEVSPAVLAAIGCLLTGCAPQKPIDRWRAARFGMFIHWGPVSLRGTEIGWSRAGERRGMDRKGTEVPVEIYDNLYKQFNPVLFDADEWVSIAKSAGMRYMVFTTKHHDGFCMFDSKLTDYKITNSPYGKDITAQLARACHRAGMPIGFYYSPPDWHHPDYRTERHAAYVEYMHGQIRELCTKYGRVATLWFDGLGGKPEDWRARELCAMIRRLQPGILINNRAGLPEDYDTPEQRVGRFQTDRPWETCMTLGHQWAWKPDDEIKPLDLCIRILVRTVGGDGNLLLNVGPMPDGRIEPRQVERLQEIGRWLAEYGEAVYNTRGGPFVPGPWGVSTHRGRTVYLHILFWEGDELRLPPIQKSIRKVRLVGGGHAAVEQSLDGLRVTVPPEDRRPIDTIVAIELDGPAAAAQPRREPSGSLAFGRKATASGSRWEDKAKAPAKTIDDDYSTSWMCDTDKDAWLEVDLAEPHKIGRAVVCEMYDRVREFEIQYKEGDEWKIAARGGRIGPKVTLRFEPVTARYVRLFIRSATDRPEIAEFHLFEE